jgi:hypothetical protein
VGYVLRDRGDWNICAAGVHTLEVKEMTFIILVFLIGVLVGMLVMS